MYLQKKYAPHLRRHDTFWQSIVNVPAEVAAGTKADAADAKRARIARIRAIILLVIVVVI
jgi:t-SNARE complex subunit (syntaxin)